MSPLILALLRKSRKVCNMIPDYIISYNITIGFLLTEKNNINFFEVAIMCCTFPEAEKIVNNSILQTTFILHELHN